MKTDQDYLKEAMKALPDGDLETILAYAKATKERDALAEGKPAEKEEAPEAEASEPPAMSEEPAEATELAAEAVEPAADPVGLMADEATVQAAVQTIEQLSGLDLAAALAVMQERAEDFTALFQGTAPSGGAADAALMSEAAQDRVKALSAQVAKRDAEVKRLGDEIAALRKDARERKIDAAIAAGHLLPGAKDRYMRLDDETLAVFLSDAQASPVVPTAPVQTSPTTRTADGDDGKDLPPKLLAQYQKAFAGLKMLSDAERTAKAIAAAREYVTNNPNDPATREQPRA